MGCFGILSILVFFFSVCFTLLSFEDGAYKYTNTIFPETRCHLLDKFWLALPCPICPMLMQQPTVRSEKKRPRDRRLGGPLFGPQCFGKIERHLWVPGVSASTSARSSLGWTTFFAAFVPGSSSTTTRNLGLEDYIAAFCF